MSAAADAPPGEEDGPPAAPPAPPLASPRHRPAPGDGAWLVEVPDLPALDGLAALLAALIRPGDLVTLTGELGAGKTALARALLRRLSGDPALEVPSPTFTLMQVYDTPLARVVHADLYRVARAADLAELGWEEEAEGAVLLVEWAERAGSALTPDRLDVALIPEPEEGPDHRVAVLTGLGSFAPRLALAKAATRLLARAGWAGAERRHLQGDASSRAYERLAREDGARAVLMLSPRRSDGPPVRGGRSYSAIAHLAEEVAPFVALAEGLRAQGLSAPAVLARDLEAGVLLLEDLGGEGVAPGGTPDPERYAAAAGVLARLHGAELPAVLPVEEGREHRLPAYDAEAFGIELELLLDWYLPRFARAATGAARGAFLAAWSRALEPVLAGPRTWTLRDYHSPNLLWLPERAGDARVGLLDFQDAVLGPPAYDLASLLQDARVDVPEALEVRLLAGYLRQRREADPGFDAAALARDYAVMAAQRATKVAGIFVRLDRRDAKPAYLAHLPRVERYAARALAHPHLAEVRAWCAEHAPRLAGEG